MMADGVTKAEIVAMLNQFKDQTGALVVVCPSVADKLRKKGVNGPFRISEPLPRQNKKPGTP